MKKFLFNILIVGFLFLVPLYVVQAIIDNRAKKNYINGTFRTLNTALFRKVDADVVIFGNSRAQCHFDTEVMDSVLSVNCYNMGLSGFPFDIQYNLVIKPYLQNNKIPKLIIYEISPQACFDHWNPIYQYAFMPYINNRNYDYYIGICNEVTNADRYLPFKYRGRKFKSFYEELKQNIGEHNGKDCFTPINRTGYTVNFVRDSVYKVERNPQILSQFRDFINECNNKGIELLLVTTPMHKCDFYDHCHTEEFLSMVDTLSFRAERLNYSMMFNSDTTYFIESTHLNSLGAKIFSKKCAEDIKAMYRDPASALFKAWNVQ